jgi:hypothetical protein
MNKGKWLALTLFFLVILGISFFYFLQYEPANSGDHFSRGQLFVDILLIPIAIFGFLFTITEFRLSQLSPDLTLIWQDHEPTNDQLTVISLSIDKNTRIYPLPTPVIELNNSGDIITNWYLLQFVFLDQRFTINDKVSLIKRNKNSDEYWEKIEIPNRTSFIFRSQGKFAAYPEFNQPICMFNLRFRSVDIDQDFIDDLEIFYTIFSDKAKKVTGKLIVRFNVIN